MADNFVRKTVQKTNTLPKLDFYELGDIMLTSVGSLYYATINGRQKAWQQIANIGHISNLTREITDLKTRVSKLETTVAAHETRIKALETPAS